MTNCKNCGAILGDGRYCQYCGADTGRTEYIEFKTPVTYVPTKTAVAQIDVPYELLNDIDKNDIKRLLLRELFSIIEKDIDLMEVKKDSFDSSNPLSLENKYMAKISYAFL